VSLHASARSRIAYGYRDESATGRKQLFSEWIRNRPALVTAPPWYVVLGAEDLLVASREATSEAAAGRTRAYISRRAVSSMALLLMAFESWLNQQLTTCYHFVASISRMSGSAHST
jgi:hypothetical protein